MTLFDYAAQHPWLSFGALIILCITVMSVAEDIGRGLAGRRKE